MKFHGHVIRFENFTKDLARHSTKSQQMTTYGRKFSIKWKNSMINSKKIHTQTRHVIDDSCKKLGHLDVRKHVNKNWENAYHSCSTKCNTSLQKIKAHTSQMRNA